MDPQIKKEKTKAKIRNDVCRNCVYVKPWIPSESRTPRRRGIAKLFCRKHNHVTRANSWCRWHGRNIREAAYKKFRIEDLKKS